MCERVPISFFIIQYSDEDCMLPRDHRAFIPMYIISAPKGRDDSNATL